MASAGRTLEQRALSLGTANAIDYALQFALPIVLTRALDAEGFGQYRLLWLAVGTLMAVAPFFMPQSLYYFVPRSDPPTRRLYVNQTMLFLAAVGAVAAWALSVWNPFLPGALEALVAGQGPALPAFVLLWTVALLLDVLPTVDERVAWQAKAVVGLSALRAVSLSAVALATASLEAVIGVLAAFAAFKVALLLAYVARHHGLKGPVARRPELVAQVRHAAPFGLSGTLYGLRGQADQWVAAALFPVTMFASFSIAGVLAPVVNLFRQSVNHVFLPSMSRLHAGGDVSGMVSLNSRANAVVALLVYPLLAFAFVFAGPLIELVYTRTYIDAATVLRVYIVGLIAFVVELNSILMLFKQGAFAARVNAAALVLSVPLSYFGATTWGLAGAALGSVLMLNAERVLSLARIARLTGRGIGALQDWGKLAAILGASALSAAVAGVLAPDTGAFARLALGGAVMAPTYLAALVLLGQRATLHGLAASLRGAAPATGIVP